MNRMTAGEYIRRYRGEKVSLRAFAKRLGWSASYVSDIERDRRPLSIKSIKKIANALANLDGFSGKWYRIYNALLMLSGQMTQERLALLNVWREWERKNWNGVNRALYEEVQKALWLET